jgi:hypothetical protein
MAGSTLKKINRFLIRFILIAIILFFCDLGIGTMLKHFYFRQKSGAPFRTTYSIDSTTAEILIFGSSRANHHYVPEIFEDSLHCSFYNTGRDGNFILYNFAIFKAITKRYHPNILIFDINPDEIEYTTNSYERLSNLLPYYHSHPEIRSTVNLRNPFEPIKLISSIYPYNSMLITIAIGNLEYNKKRKSDNKGYVPIFKKMENEKIDTTQIIGKKNIACIDENKMHALKDIIIACKQQKIRLIFVQSPTFIFKKESYYNSLFLQMCSENDVSYFDFSNQKIFINHPDYFADRSHLNDHGAKIFSSMVANKILEALHEPN